MTVKAYPDAKIAFASLSFNRTDEDQYLAAVAAHFAGVKNLTDAGVYVNAQWLPDPFGVPLIVWYDHTQEELDALTSSYLQSLRNTGVDVAYHSTEYPSYLDMYSDQPSVQDTAVGTYLFGGRLVPKALFESEDGLQSLLDVVTTLIRNGEAGFFAAIPSIEKYPDNAILPAWRESLGLMVPIV